MGATATAFPPRVRHELEGWELFWAELEVGSVPPGALAALRTAVAVHTRAKLTVETVSAHPTVAAVRRLFRQAGCDPTRYRPSSEALIRRLLKGEELPAIHPLVDVNNALSVEAMVPACVMAPGAVAPPFTLRRGQPGESMLSLRGPFELEGKPLLADEKGAFSTPITDSERVRVTASACSAWLVAYLPAGVVDWSRAETLLRELVGASGVIRVTTTTAAGRTQ